MDMERPREDRPDFARNSVTDLRGSAPGDEDTAEVTNSRWGRPQNSFGCSFEGSSL